MCLTGSLGGVAVTISRLPWRPFLASGALAPQQKDHDDDDQYRAESPTIIMVWGAQIETTAAEKENQNNQE
jgi:hypothetical protein